MVMAAPPPNAIRTSDHIALLHRVLEHYGLPADHLEIVPDVYAWWWQHGIPETTWPRQAKCIDLGDGRCLIALRSKLYDPMISARRVALELLGLRVTILDSAAKYVAQLLLRELAHVVLKIDDEKYRDEWALAELTKHLSLSALH